MDPLLAPLLDALRGPWPWWVAGPLIGLVVPLLLLLGDRAFGISGNLRHVCAMLPAPRRPAFFRYDWRPERWNLAFALGIVLGGALAATLLADPEPLRVAGATERDLAALGVSVDGGFAPAALFGAGALSSWRGLLLIVGGGFLIGFGARWAGGCTSGHAIHGLATLQLPSLVAVLGFFAGGLFATWVLLPLVLRGFGG